MMTELRRMFATLKAEIAQPKNAHQWETAMARHPILKRLLTIDTVLGILKDPANKALRYKDIITRAIIAEHKRNPGAFWTAVLLIAYSPMLNRLRGRIYGNTYDNDDLDQLVIGAFLDVARSFPLLQKRSKTFLHLRRMTEQRVFKKLRTRQKEIKEQHQIASLAKRLDDFDLFGEIPPDDESVDPEEMAELLIRIADGQEPSANIELVINTIIYKTNLKDYVHRTYPCDDAEQQERVYQRIKRQRLRTLNRLKGYIKEACPTQDHDDVYPFESTNINEANEVQP